MKKLFQKAHIIEEKNAEDDKSVDIHPPTNIAKDWDKIIFLTLLYCIQGVPVGLVQSVSFLMSSRHVSYADQGTFSMTLWPYSMKLFLAPVVDSVYWRRLGRRKSWIVPMQLIIGVFFISVASYVHELFEVNSDSVSIHKSKSRLS